MKKQYIDKSALVAEIEKRIEETKGMQPKFDQFWAGQISAFKGILKILDTIEVKEVNIADMADDYYDALMEEASVWMDEGTMCHCRLAYYTGCKDVLNKLQKGE